VAAALKILIVDDDSELAEMLSEYLVPEGFSVAIAGDGLTGVRRVESESFDLVVLDIMLPRLGGLDTLKAIREQSRVPVVMLTAKGDPVDRVLGLELGADDYIPKPFEPRELLARIRAVLRRAQPPDESPQTAALLQLGGLHVDPRRRSASFDGQVLALTPLEFDLLCALVTRAGEVVSREALASSLGRKLLSFDRSIDMHIVGLRRKLDALPSAPKVVTVRGSGYLMAPPELA